jgi:hypothetical protein
MDLDLWYTADWDLWLKLAQSGSAVYNREVTTAFRVHAGSLTMKGSHNEQDFAAQLRTVLARHGQDATARSAVLAEASVRVNIALAAAANGRLRALADAIVAVARLGPLGARDYVHHSRILDRAIPRLRAKLAGAF